MSAWCVPLAMTLLLAAPPSQEEAKKDWERLQGTWNVVTFEVEGKAPGEEAQIRGSYIFAGDKVSIRKLNDQVQDGRFRVSADTNPRAMDVLVVGESEKPMKLEWIYELHGDNLRIAGNHPGKGRPTGFDPQSAFFVIILKRDKS